MQLVCCISRIPVFCQLTALELNAVIAFVLPERGVGQRRQDFVF